MKNKIKLETSKSGFTIIELMLAMTFVSTLLISISLVTINILSIYQRGLTLKAVNSVGRSLVSEFTTTIDSSPAVDTTSLCNRLAGGNNKIHYKNAESCIADHANRYVYNDRYDDNGRQYSGVFCTGSYSYLWNTRYTIGEQDGGSIRTRTLSLRYRDEDGKDQIVDTPRLVRIPDRSYRVCSAFLEVQDNPEVGKDWNWSINIITEASNDGKEKGAFNPISKPTEGYLSAFDLDLYLYELTVQPISQDNFTLRTYMTGNFILATERGNIDITASGDYCQNSETSQLNNLGAEFNYCAINKFNFAARTAGV